MNSTFEIFQKYNSKAEINEIATLLKNNNIEFVIFNSQPNLGTTILGSDLDYNYQLKIHSSDFEKATTILEQQNSKIIEEINNDYFLFQFTNDELIDVVKKPDEWGVLNNQLAIKILSDRNVHFEKEAIKDLKKVRNEELSVPDKANKWMIIIGYFFIPFGSILSLIIGYILFYNKKNLLDGKKIYSYTTSDRKHGNRILIGAGIFLFLYIIYFLFLVFL